MMKCYNTKEERNILKVKEKCGNEKIKETSFQLKENSWKEK